MTADHLALLAAVLDRPADDTVRLVLADWLDENATQDRPCEQCHGDGSIAALTGRIGCMACSPAWDRRGTGMVPGNRFAERAEFIRLQVELSRWHTPPGAGSEDFRWHRRLSNRAGELFGRFCDQWFPVPAGYGFNWHITTDPSDRDTRPRYLVARGFVSEARLPLSALTPEVARNLGGAHPLERVVLADKVAAENTLCSDGSFDGYYWQEFDAERWGILSAEIRPDARHVPPHLFKLLAHHRPAESWPLSRNRVYDTRESAAEALAIAAALWCRHLAGTGVAREGGHPSPVVT